MSEEALAELKWTPETGRHAHIYVFARQWRFYVLATDRLPATKSISLARLGPMSQVVSWADLGSAVEHVRAVGGLLHGPRVF